MSSLNPIIFAMVLVVGSMSSAMVVAQNCGCQSEICCSRDGYCGTTAEYCGEGCQQGPCYSSGGGGGSSVIVRNLMTDAFFDDMLNNASASNCPGRNFYSRNAFFNALDFYPQFGTGGSSDVTKREVAAFFAHVTHETRSFCYIEEINKQTYCDKRSTWPCNPSKQYYGRGPLQLTWNYNYGPAGKSIGFDGINAPETVAKNSVIAFRTAFWFWMNNVHSLILSGQGFGATIRAINGIECNGGYPDAVNARIRYYREYCNQLGVSPGNNLSC